MDELVLLVYSLVFLALVYGSLTDLKKREVPDILNYGLIFAGIGIRIMASYVYWDWMPLLEGVLGLGIFFALGALMFYTGQWGGGDSKLLFGMGAMLGVPFALPDVLDLPFMVSFIINLVFVGAIYGMLWSVVLALRNGKEFFKSLEDILGEEDTRRQRYWVWGLAVLFVLLSFVFPSDVRVAILSMAAICVLAFYLYCAVRAVENTCMYKRLKPSQLVEGDWISENVLVNKKQIARAGLLSAKSLQMIAEIYEKNAVVFTVERKKLGMVSVKQVLAEQLQVGDVLVESVRFHSVLLKRGTVLDDAVFEKLAREYGRFQFTDAQITPTSMLYSKMYFDPVTADENTELLEDLYVGEVLCGPGDLGIETEQIDLLKKFKIPYVMVKEGIPFVPSFLGAFLLTLAIGGNVLYLVL